MHAKNPNNNYRMVHKKQEDSKENEIRVKAVSRPFIYAAYAGKLLFEKKFEKVFMLATGAATAKVIQSVEYIRKRVKGLMVCYEIESTEFIDEYEPLVEGLDSVEIKRLVPTLKAYLFLTPLPNLMNKPGFLPPLPIEEITDEENFMAAIEDHFSKDRRPHPYGEGVPYDNRPRGNGFRGRSDRFRGDRGDNQQRGPRTYNDYRDRTDGEERPRGGYRGRGRGSFRGIDRGGFREVDNTQKRTYSKNDEPTQKNRYNDTANHRNEDSRTTNDNRHRDYDYRGGYNSNREDRNRRGGRRNENYE